MLFLLAIVGILNYIAVENSLYWSTNEFDSIVHFFGGATWGAFFLWFYFFSGFFSPKKRDLFNFLLISVISSMFIAIGWEIYELVLGEAVFSGPNYQYDTTLDIIMDTLGILAACFYGYMKEIELKNKDEQKN